MNAFTGARNDINIKNAAPAVIIHTEATRLKPVVAIDSPYEVLGKPQTAVPTADATPSPIRVRSRPGLTVKSVPMILDKHLWSE